MRPAGRIALLGAAALLRLSMILWTTLKHVLDAKSL